MNLTFEDNVLFFHLAPLRACKENNLQNLGRKISDRGPHLGSPILGPKSRGLLTSLTLVLRYRIYFTTILEAPT